MKTRIDKANEDARNTATSKNGPDIFALCDCVWDDLDRASHFGNVQAGVAAVCSIY